MSKRRFTKEQIEELLKNKNVARCSEKSITYSKDFKVSTIEKYEAGLSPREIFKDAGFDLTLIGKRVPKAQLSCWRKIQKNKGLSELRIETRGLSHNGGRPKTKDLTDADRIKRMEIEIAYLKAENDFLAKLRAAKKR